MADDIDITPGSGKTVSTDEVTDRTGTVRHYQRVKIVTGPDGASSPPDVSNAEPMPVHATAIEELLRGVLTELRVLTAIMANDTGHDPDDLRKDQQEN